MTCHGTEKVRGLCAALGLLASMAGTAAAQPIASESFVYSPPGLTLPEYTPGGSGWAFPWDGGWRVSQGSLHYTGGAFTVASSGNKIEADSAVSQRIMNVAPLGTPGTSVWVSMLAKQTAGTAANTFAGLRLPTGPNTFIYMGKPYGIPNWGIDGGPGTTKRQSTVPATQESLLVMRVDFNAGADDVYLWVNPPLSAVEPPRETASVTALAYNNFQDITKVLLEMGSVGSSIHAQVDEVRVARDWSNAVAMVPPAVLCVTPRNVGGCCYEFDLGQSWGTSSEFPGVVMTLPAGTTVASATTGTMPAGSTVTYTPGGSTVRWDLPSGTYMNSFNGNCLTNFKVSVCFNSVTSNVTTVTFDGVNGSYLGPQNHVLSGPTCTYSQATCCDTWKPATAGIQPGVPIDAAMVYDEQNQASVLWGGMDCNGVVHNGLWVRKNTAWAPVTAVAGNGNGTPSARRGHAMVYDPDRHVIVMYGGCNAGQTAALGDLWELRFDGANWAWDLRTPGGPAHGPVFDHAMAYDPISRQVVIFGGYSTISNSWVSTCTGWNGSTFIAKTAMPGATSSPTAVLDESRQSIVVLSGITLSMVEFSNGAWTTPAVAVPSALGRLGVAMAYNSACGRVIINGGWDFSPATYSDTWSYDGSSFTSLSTPTSPQPRSDHCMAWDKKLQRLVMYGGTDGLTATCTNNTWHFDSGAATARVQGWTDGFSATSIDPPPTLSAPFLAARPALATAVFDQTVNNKVFGASLPIPAWARTKITKAVLEIRARPVSGDASNDTFGLTDYARGIPTSLWSTSFANLPACGGNWNGGHAATTILLDLSALPVYNAAGVLQPATTDLIGDLNASGSFPDLYVQDDTAIDYVRLHLWTCPPPRRWFGFDAIAVGNAILTTLPGPGAQLMVGNIGGTGNDGVRFELGDAQGADLHWSTPPFADSPVGATMDITAYGTVNDVAGTQVCRTHAVKTASDRVAFTCAAGSPTNRVDLYNQGTLVASFPGVGADEPSYMISNNWNVDWHCNDPAHILFVWCGPTFANPALAVVHGQPVASVDFMKFTPEGPVPPVRNVQAVTVTAAGISQLTFDQAAARVFDAAFSSPGGGMLDPHEDSVTVAPGGDSGQDCSVDMSFAPTPYVSSMMLDEMVFLSTQPGIDVRELSVSGGDLPAGASLGMAFRTAAPPAGQDSMVLQLAWPTIGTPNARCILYNGPVQVASISDVEIFALRFDRLPTRHGWAPTPSGSCGFFADWETGACYIPGTGVVNVTKVVLDPGTSTPTSIGAMSVSAGEFSSGFTLADVSFTPPCQADFNGDGFVDFFDIDAFVEAFETGDPSGDFNQDGFIDFFDIDAFVEAFETGC